MMFEPEQKTPWVDRGWYVVTEFERTPSINFQRAVELAKTHPGFTPLMDERNVLIYRNLYRPEDLLHFQEMLKLIKNWKGSKLYLKGERIGFDMLDSGVNCYIRTVLKSSSQPELQQDCQKFHPNDLPVLGCIGCRRSHVTLEWPVEEFSEHLVWFAFGKLDHNRVYHLQKDELEGAVMGELLDYRSCPLLDPDALHELIQRLPDRIDPRKDREWQYNRRYRQVKSRMQYHLLASRESEILPVSADAYRAYLKRIFLP